MALTEEGFTRPTLPEIKTGLDTDFTNALGPVNTNPDAVAGQVIGIISEAVDSIQSIMQDVYDAMYPRSAEGTSLDGAVSFVGLSRLDAHTGTGNMKVSGLPIAADLNAVKAALASWYHTLTIGAGKALAALVDNGTTNILLYSVDPAGGTASLLPIDSTGSIRLSGSYEI